MRGCVGIGHLGPARWRRWGRARDDLRPTEGIRRGKNETDVFAADLISPSACERRDACIRRLDADATVADTPRRPPRLHQGRNLTLIFITLFRKIFKILEIVSSFGVMGLVELSPEKRFSARICSGGGTLSPLIEASVSWSVLCGSWTPPPDAY